MSNLMKVMGEIINHPEDIEKVFITHDDRTGFNFRGTTFHIYHYWDERREQTEWVLRVYSTESDFVVFSTSQSDLAGRDDLFEALYRVVEEKRQNVGDIFKGILKKT